jgi:endonuclease/exonuclease/phosphatase (EEP) superfamily protein YafD
MKDQKLIHHLRQQGIWFAPILLSICILFMAEDYGWPLALFLHFSLHILVAGLGYAVLLMIRGHRIAAALMMLVSLMIGWGPLKSSLTQQKPSSTAKAFRLVHYNVQLSNQNPESVMAILKHTEADIVFLHELTPFMWSQIMSSQEQWPFSRAIPRPDYYGVGVLSRLPLAELRFQELVNGNIPVAIVRVAHLNFPHVIISPHLIPPLGSDSHILQLKQMNEMADLLSSQPPSSILIGDLNSTPHHPDFKRFLQKSGLQDGRVGFGILPSWPHPIAWLGIAIDHVLVRGAFEVGAVEFKDGGDSDHRALVADISLKQ